MKIGLALGAGGAGGFREHDVDCLPRRRGRGGGDRSNAQRDLAGWKPDLYPHHLPGPAGLLCLRVAVPEHGGGGPAGNGELEMAGLHDGLHGGPGLRRRLAGADRGPDGFGVR